VQSVDFRSAELELDDGTVAYVGHGQVGYAINRSRGRGGAAVIVHVPNDLDAEAVRSELDAVVNEIREERGLTRMVFGPPQVEEVHSDGESTLAVRVEARPERRREVEAAVRTRVTTKVASISERITVEE
jgi:small-conductance mechanosensitive channel